MESDEWENLKDRLVLEIQRSLDYYESQMGQNPINRIVIAQRQHDSAAMVESLNSMLTAEVSVLNIAEHLDCAKELSSEDQQIGMAAIAATLRGGKNKATAGKKEQEAA